MVMKCAVLLLLASPWAWAADQVKDRAAIDKVISSLNDVKVRPDAGEVWSEMSRPIVVTRSVQFISRNVARVEASRVRHGSVMSSTVPMVILVEKKRGQWKITPITLQPVRLLPE